MQKGCLVLLVLSIVFFCSILVFLVAGRIIYPDKTVFEHVIDDLYIVRIRTIGSWEGNIPVYLEVESKDGKTLRSNEFTSYSPKQIKSRGLGLEIHKVENLIFMYNNENPHKILVIVSFEDDLVYPRIWRGEDIETNKLYYAQVRKLFFQLKKLLKDEDVSLYGLVPPDK